MSILAKLALVLGGLVFFMIVFIVCLAFSTTSNPPHEKPLRRDSDVVPYLE
jgi:hypothetical protein